MLVICFLVCISLLKIWLEVVCVRRYIIFVLSIVRIFVFMKNFVFLWFDFECRYVIVSFVLKEENLNFRRLSNLFEVFRLVS